MYITEFFLLYHIRQVKCGGKCRRCYLLLPEGHAVSTLVNSGVHLVSTHHNAVQRAVVLALAMMGTLLDGTLDALVGTIHLFFLLCLNSYLVWLYISKVFR